MFRSTLRSYGIGAIPRPGPDLPAASERLRERAAAELSARLPEHLGRLGWNRARLAAHQRNRFRGLLAHAAAHSRFHAAAVTASSEQFTDED